MVKPLLKKVTNAQLLLCELLLRIGLHDTLAFFSWYNAMCALRISLMLNINTTEILGMQPVLHKLSLLDHDDNYCGTVIQYLQNRAWCSLKSCSHEELFGRHQVKNVSMEAADFFGVCTDQTWPSQTRSCVNDSKHQ